MKPSFGAIVLVTLAILMVISTVLATGAPVQQQTTSLQLSGTTSHLYDHPLRDAEDTPIAESLDIKLSVAVNRSPNRYFSLRLNNPTSTISSPLQVTFTPSAIVKVVDPKEKLYCDVLTNEAPVALSVGMTFDKGVMMISFSDKAKLIQDESVDIVCENVAIDFTKFTTATETEIAFNLVDSPIKQSFKTILDPTRQFAKYIELTLAPVSGVKNVRKFTIVVNHLYESIPELRSLKLTSPLHPEVLVPIDDTVNAPECYVNDNERVPTGYIIAEHALLFDFGLFKIEIGSSFVLTCSHTHYFDFSGVIGQPITFELFNEVYNKKLSATVDPIDDHIRPSDVEWPFTIKLPIRSALQPALIIELTSLPDLEIGSTVAQDEDVLFHLETVGVSCKNSPNVNSITTTTRHVDSGQTETKTIYFTTDEKCNIVNQQLTFLAPSDGTPQTAAYSMIIRLATVSTTDNLSINFKLQDLSTSTTYHLSEDAQKTTYPFNSSIVAAGSKPISMVYRKYYNLFNDKTNLYPTFEIHIPKTAIPLEGTILTLTTDTTIPGSPSTSPASFSSLSHIFDYYTCHLVEAKTKVATNVDKFGQYMTFDFTGIQYYSTAGKPLTISCPQYVVLPKSQTDTKIRFGLDLTLDGKHSTDSWQMTSFDPDSATTGAFKMVLITVLILVLVAGAGFALWTFIIKPTCMGSKNREEPLIGDYQALTESAL